jgi:hypothetical protein
MTWKESIFKFLQNISNTCVRFPLSLICSVLAAILLIYAKHLNSNTANDILGNNLVRLSLEAIAGIPMFYAFHIFCENKDLDVYKRFGFIILGLSLLGLHFYSIPNGTYHFDNNYTIRYLTLLASVHLIISFSLYYSKKEVESFWYYNEFLFVRFITVVLFSITFYLGIIGAMWGIDKLLDARLNYNYYYDVFLIIMIPLNTLFFYSGLPLDSHHFEKERKYQNALRIFVQYILIPILIIYGAILLIYLIKIVINGETPSGEVCMPILIYSALGILTFLLSYPIRNGKYFLVKIFYKNFFFVLLPMLTLFFKAIISQILKYSFTETRYLTLVVGIWLAVICFYSIIKREINIIFFPISLALVFIFSTFGPWGMYDTSGYSQFRRLKSIMQENNLLENGKINASKNINKIIRKDQTEAILSSIQYLYTHHQIDRIKPLLNDTDYAKLVALEDHGLTEGNARNLLGFDSEGLINSIKNETTYSTFTSKNFGFSNQVLHIAPYNKIIQINALNLDPENIEINAETEYIQSVINESTLILYKNKDTIFKTNCQPCQNLHTRIMQLQQSDSSILKYALNKMDLSERIYQIEKDSLTVELDNARLFIDEIKFKVLKNKVEPVQINGVLAY